MHEALTYERIQAARETLSAAFGLSLEGGFPGAIDQPEPDGVFCEAKRNLTALVQHLHGQAAFERMLSED